MTLDDLLTYMEEHYDPNVWDSSYNYLWISSEGNHTVRFQENGDITVSDDMDNYDITIAEHRPYEHMIKIIEGLLK